MLELRKVSLTKGKKSLLEELYLSLPKGRITLILGKSGSGKTSLLRCLGQLEAYSGEIFFQGTSLKKLSSQERSQQIGFVSQSYALFPHLTVLENCLQPMRLSKKKRPQENALSILDSLGLTPWLKAYPHELSGGQQQRVALARALLLAPSFLLLDEPSSALDPENTNLLAQILKNLAFEGRGIVIATQDMALAEKLLDQVLFLEEGKLLEKFDTQTSLEKPSRIFTFLGLDKK